MPRQTSLKTDFTFVGGLVTDGSFLTTPQNAWRDGDNIIPFLDGHIERRVKLDVEALYNKAPSFDTTTKELHAFSVSLWSSVGGDGLLTFAVVQEGQTVRFYDTSTSSISPNIKAFTIDLNTYKSVTSTNVFGTSLISMASGNGKLIIVSADTDPILVSYAAATDTISVTRLTLQIRDFSGLPDSTAVDTRPAALTSTHNYNLKNQGWTDTHINTYFAAIGLYPSDAQIWLQGKDSSDNFSPTLLDKQDFGNGSAPKGRYILDVFNRDRTTVSGVAGLTTETEAFRPTTTTFFAGRAWYSGISSDTLGSWILFSRIAETDAKYAQCYQEGDPTAEWTNDLLASDGGVIPIPNAGGIVKLQALQDSLLVFAQNGIWQILGDVGGFRADGYQVKQIASFGVVSGRSVVEVENTLAFWSSAGIYILEKDNVSGDYVPKSISQKKISDLYQEYQETSHISYVSGFYDSVEKIIHWLHHVHSDGSFTSVDRYKVSNILSFDLELGAFYTKSIADLSSNSPVVVGGFLSPNLSSASVTLNVVDSSGNQIVTGADTIVATVDFSASSPRIPKFLTIVPDGANWALTFSDFLNTENTPNKFKDWYNFDGVGAETATLPYIITNYEILTDASRYFQAPYIVTHLHKTETGIDSNGDPINESSCLLQGRWDWTDDSAGGRWTSAQEVYRHRQPILFANPSATFTTGYPLVVAKTKIRGRGRSLHLKFTSASGKDMKIAGWAVQLAKNTNV